MPHCFGGLEILTSEDIGAKEWFYNLHILAEIFAWCHSFIFAYIESSEVLHHSALRHKIKNQSTTKQRQEERSKIRNGPNCSI